jgi:hypothetical protein
MVRVKTHFIASDAIVQESLLEQGTSHLSDCLDIKNLIAVFHLECCHHPYFADSRAVSDWIIFHNIHLV